MVRLTRVTGAYRTAFALLAIFLFHAAAVHGADAARPGDPHALARQILDASGVRGGLVVHLGCGDGHLTAALGASDAYLVHGLDADAKNVDAARKHLRDVGLADKVSVERLSGKRLPYVDNLVNLVVVESLGQVPMAEVMRVLAPRGVAYVNAGGTWTKSVKPWPSEIDEWTHYLHGPDNNAVAKDSRIGPPQGVQWIEGPQWQRHHEMNANPNAMVSAGGRLFYIVDKAPATVAGLPDEWSLVARDAFNGLQLWQRPVDDWGWKAWSAVQTGGRFNLPLHIPRRMVAAGDRLFVTLGFNAPLVALDAATGKTVQTYDGTQFTDEILYCDGLFVLSINEAAEKPDTLEQWRARKRRGKPGQAAQDADQPPENPPVKKRIAVVDARSGETLWTKRGFSGVPSSPIFGNQEQITRLLMAVGGGRIVCVEKDALLAFDLNTGRELWRTPRPPLPPTEGRLRENLVNFSTLVIHQDVAVFLQTEESYTLPPSTGNRGVHCKLMGLSLDTGKVLWTQPCSKWGPGVEGDVFAVGDLVWTFDPAGFTVIGVDLHTGQIRRTIDVRIAFDEVHHHRCFRNKATEEYLLTGRRGIETIDLQDSRITKNEWVRGACRYGIMPANGLIYVPPHPCQCYIDVKISGFYALTSENEQGEKGRRGEGETAKSQDETPRLKRGPAYPGGKSETSSKSPNVQISKSLNSQPSTLNSADWLTYRHDAERSGSTPAAVPGRPAELWATDLGDRASACTIGGGRVFAASVDQHRVVALDAATGSVLWDYTVGGRVDTPPTINGSHVLFGSAAGWVYCLRADDGALAWRFRASPNERRIVAHGQLESLWPVHGTVLVNDGVAYVAAGRSTHLDGGIRVCALNPATGELIRPLEPLNDVPEGLDDVLVAEGDRVFMRQLEYSLTADSPAAPGKGSARKGSPAGRRAFSTAGLLDDSCFARVGWSTKNPVKRNGKTGKGALADLLVFDGQSIFSFESRRTGGFGGWFEAGTGAYELVAFDKKASATKPRWKLKIPVRVRAMAAAGGLLLAAGSPDVVEPTDPWASIEGRDGGVLWLIDTADGTKQAEIPLPAAPAWDGLAVADNKILLTTVNGKVICLGAAKK